MRRVAAALCMAAWVGVAPAQDALDATTAAGDKVRLFPDGRWEYVDADKRAKAQAAQPQAQPPGPCPPGSQGALFGIGRCIPPGDPQYNRGSVGRGK